MYIIIIMWERCRKHVSGICGKYSCKLVKYITVLPEACVLHVWEIFLHIRKIQHFLQEVWFLHTNVSLKWQNFCRNYISYTCRKHASCIFKVQAKNEVKVTWNL